MANTLPSPTGGLQPFNRQDGGSPTAGMTQVWIASTDASLFFRGDLVIPSSGGGSNNSGNYITSPQFTASSTGVCAGVFMGCEYYQPTVGRTIWSNTWPGSVTGSTGDVRAYIIDDPAQLFICFNSTNGTVTSSLVGLNIQPTLNSTTGNTTTGLSNIALASSTVGSTNSNPLRIVDFYSNYAPPGVPNIGTSAFVNGTDNTTAANILVVRLNNAWRTNLTARSS